MSGTRDGRNADEEDNGMVVPKNEVTTFLDTLREYSASCTDSREHIENKREALAVMEANVESVVRDCKKQCADAVKKIDIKMKQLSTMAANNKKEKEDMKTERETFEQLVEKAREKCREINVILRRVTVKETYVISYVELSKESEMIRRTQYKRAVNAGYIYKEVENCTLLSLTL